MARNGSGTYSLPAGNPPTAGTTITVSWASTTLNDIATALTQSLAYDGQTTPIANLPMGGFVLTGLGAGSSAGQSVRYEQVLLLTGGTLSGDLTLTNTGLHILDTNATHDLIIKPGSNITADRTLTLTTGDADRTLTLSGNLTVGNTTTLNGVLTLGTSQASTSGTSIDFTAIPSWAQQIVITFVGVSTSGTSNPLIQLGTSSTPETSGYLGAGTNIASASNPTNANYTTGFGWPGASAANVYHGSLTITLVKASTFTWACCGTLGASNASNVFTFSGSKSLAAALDSVRITTVGGADTFDAGLINIAYS